MLPTGGIRDWQEFAVDWDVPHDQGTEGAHHARIARFLRDNQVQAIAAAHPGPGVVTGMGGDAPSAARAAG